MTTDELFSAIERGGGRAIIGLKDSMAPGGFDERGIKLADRAATSRAKSRLRALGVSFDYEFKLDDPVVIARVSRPLLERLRRHPFVDYVEPNVSVQVASDSLPWNIVRVNAGLAQAYSQGAGVKLLIMDTGADLTNPDLHYSVSWRCVDGSSVSDATGHGTHVAGIAAAQVNGSGIVGVAPQVTLMSANVRRLGTVGEIDLNEVACSINVARANGVFAVNMSFGGPTSVQTTAVNDQIAAGYNQNGMIFVAATGNTVSNGGPVYWPASRPE
nr:S8 family serine peptidase [Gemmatimonadaceae bacterium]